MSVAGLNPLRFGNFTSSNPTTNTPSPEIPDRGRSSSGPPRASIGVIIGGAIGGVVFLFIVVGVLLWSLRKRRRKKADQSDSMKGRLEMPDNQVQGLRVSTTRQICEANGTIDKLAVSLLIHEAPGDTPIHEVPGDTPANE